MVTVGVVTIAPVIPRQTSLCSLFNIITLHFLLVLCHQMKDAYVTVDITTLVYSKIPIFGFLLHDFPIIHLQAHVVLDSPFDCCVSLSRVLWRWIVMAKSSLTRLTKVWKEDYIGKHFKKTLMETLVFTIATWWKTWTVKAACRKSIEVFGWHAICPQDKYISFAGAKHRSYKGPNTNCQQCKDA